MLNIKDIEILNDWLDISWNKSCATIATFDKQ